MYLEKTGQTVHPFPSRMATLAMYIWCLPTQVYLAPGTAIQRAKQCSKIGQGRCRNNVQKNFLALGYFSRFLWAGPCCTARMSFGSYIFDNC